MTKAEMEALCVVLDRRVKKLETELTAARRVIEAIGQDPRTLADELREYRKVAGK